MTTPTFAPVDADTADLLDLIAEDANRLPWVRDEWAAFQSAINIAADNETNIIDQTVLRDLCREHVAPQNVGAFTRRACREGLMVWTGDYAVSTDVKSRNGGKPVRVYRRLEGI